MRTGKMEKELAALKGHKWAGTYRSGTWAGGTMFRIAPQSGFLYRPYTDAGLEAFKMFDYGEVSVERGRFYVMPVRGFFLSHEIYFVRWGARHLLIPDAYMLHFVNLVNAGCEQYPSEGYTLNLYFYTKEGEQKAPLYGTPALPYRFGRLLLKAPLNARLTSIGESTVEGRWRITQVKINAGTKEGVWSGMEFFPEGPNLNVTSLHVRQVAEHSADAEVEMSITLQGEKTPLPTVGQPFSTRLKKPEDSRFCR